MRDYHPDTEPAIFKEAPGSDANLIQALGKEIKQLRELNADLLTELQHTQQMRANEFDEFLKLQKLNAELLAAAKALLACTQNTDHWTWVDMKAAIAKAETMK
jgi:hypothetical protein